MHFSFIHSSDFSTQVKVIYLHNLTIINFSLARLNFGSSDFSHNFARVKCTFQLFFCVCLCVRWCRHELMTRDLLRSKQKRREKRKSFIKSVVRLMKALTFLWHFCYQLSFDLLRNLHSAFSRQKKHSIVHVSMENEFIGGHNKRKPKNETKRLTNKNGKHLRLVSTNGRLASILLLCFTLCRSRIGNKRNEKRWRETKKRMRIKTTSGKEK